MNDYGPVMTTRALWHGASGSVTPFVRTRALYSPYLQRQYAYDHFWTLPKWRATALIVRLAGRTANAKAQQFTEYAGKR